MIIDLILDRKFGYGYNAHNFYCNVMRYNDVLGVGGNIAAAMDYGEEKDVREALADYIIKNQYNPAIVNYINSVNWL